MSKDTIQIYTDGGCCLDTKIGGWGAVIILNKKEHKINMYTSDTTNNKMELTAIIEALYFIKIDLKCDCTSPIEIYTDSQYCKNGITDWINNWKENGWKTADKKPVKNKDLWINLDNISQKFNNLNWNWVKAHNGNEYNEMADQLATEAINQLKKEQEAFSIDYNAPIEEVRKMDIDNIDFEKEELKLSLIHDYEADLIKNFKDNLNSLNNFLKDINKTREILAEMQSTCIKLDICLNIKNFNNKESKENGE